VSIGYYQLETGRVAAIELDCPFPPLSQALNVPNGLVAIGGDLSTKRLLSAYKQGVFPWFNDGEPIMWWSPNPRMVLYPNALKISSSLKKTLKKNTFEIRLNSAFRQVITACSQALRDGQAGTWISPAMIDAYCQLHALGHAISMESWQDNQLVGGCYGIQIGRMFYGESMFHTQTDASKVAFVHLVNYLQKQQVELIDCQMKTPLLASFGGQEIDRETFMQQLTKLVNF
jgi:leucyl/phenylalanyl-tRNA---protein transferase